LEINPNYADAHNNIGVALARKGDVKNAINHYYRVLACGLEFADLTAMEKHE
jgi:Flp pilus assembly protein TadD